MKTGKTLVCGILAVVLTLVFAACPEPETKSNSDADTDDGSMKGVLAFELINNGTAYRVGKGTVRDGAVVIPATYNGLPVTEIGSIDDEYSAFGGIHITAVTIPASVTVIGYYAFGRCFDLTGVTFAADSRLQTIGRSAFSQCTSLTSITLGNSVTIIGERAFSECTSLTSITIPDSVTTIGNVAFSGCTGLTSITLGISVTTIGDDAFYECTSLTSITIPDSVTTIGRSAFENCTGLTSVTLGVSVTTISAYAFSRCTNLTVITVNSGNPNFASEGGVLYNKDKTQMLTVPLGITAVTIPASVTTISYWVFNDCTRLTAITVNSGNANYASEGGVLYNKDKTSLIMVPQGITTVTISSGVTTISNSAFSGCTSLTSITIPDSVTTIDWYAFAGCTSLTSITIPNSVTEIGIDAFSGCYGLRSVTIGADVSLSEYGAFPGDLDSVYTTTNSKAAGTYTSANGSSWTKQS